MTLLTEHKVIQNNLLAQQVVEEMLRKGIQECCIAAGSRNAPLVYALTRTKQIKVYNWSEERSAAFFALGRAKASQRPVAVLTTSGTASAELLPAAMMAYYLGLPLLLLTADRPRRFRKSGAPQTAEQVGLFGCYAHHEQDLEKDEVCNLSDWSCRGPAHVNVCFEEPKDAECQLIQMDTEILDTWIKTPLHYDSSMLTPLKDFLNQCRFPLVVLGGLDKGDHSFLIQFLLKLGAPIYAEGFSNLREEKKLEHLQITRIDRIWEFSAKHGYPIDGILRVGEIPTVRLWRDVEEMGGKIKVCSISELPFSGISWADVIQTSLDCFFSEAAFQKEYPFQKWKNADLAFQHHLQELFIKEPHAEPSLIHALSHHLKNAHVYLGNSLPIREWDLAATYEPHHRIVQATRGVNGIDGQISTFLGLCQQNKENWAILGDLTILYDMVGPWILNQLPSISANIVVVNNQGGQIFSRLYKHPIFINEHVHDFSYWAKFWNMDYEKWFEIPNKINPSRHRLIELVPDTQATARFWEQMALL